MRRFLLKPILLLMVCAFCHNTILPAQSYMPMAQIGNRWFDYENFLDLEGYYESFTVDGDTIADGRHYMHLHHEYQTYSPVWMGGTIAYIHFGDVYVVTEPDMFLREDTIQRKVFISAPGTPDSLETLLYDFGLSVGDTLDFGILGYPKIVQSEDSVLIGGHLNRRMHIATTDDPTSAYVDVIEGVGSIFGLNAGVELPFETALNLLCFTHNDTTTTHFIAGSDPLPADLTSECDFHEPTPIETIQDPSGIQLFPDPAHDILNVITTYPSGTITIFNASGAAVITVPFTASNTQMNISALPPGIYFLVLQSEKGIWSGKFVKE